MSEINRDDFHQLALKTSPFKGRSGLYYCYLKSEKIASALAYIFRNSDSLDSVVLNDLLQKAGRLPGIILRYGNKSLPQAMVVAEVFDLIALIRFVTAQALITEQNGLIICREYEGVIRRLMEEGVVSFLSLEDFAVPEIVLPEVEISSMSDNKGQNKRQTLRTSPKGQNIRAQTILKIVNENKKVSIKDISKIVRDCSEKTIQRELTGLMQQGLVRKEGERRWSVYIPAGARL